MKKIIRGSYRYIVIFFVIIIAAGCHNDSTSVNSDDIKNILLEEYEDGRIKVTYNSLHGEDQINFKVAPGETYSLDYELRSDEGIFDVKIVDESNNLIYQFPLFNDLVNIHRKEIDQNSHLRIIGGTVTIESEYESIIVLVNGHKATGYLKLNLIVN
ncbi:hypothetical protein [Alkaliphilus serpentinus]|uniref:Lipoprotein n=1 Tax=Alkaliphilus serpentinus TaxID=1482731 RepID=A0A833HRD7_9FIRM|nr:hypothetical protein [Alkaliphilus serpentinus]KAB3533119.1 hypothetical protein F8153_00795 [Alkaliphilus serpentinus]